MNLRSDISIVPREQSATPWGTVTVFDTVLTRRWWVIAGPNGGYIAALIANAASEAQGDESRVPRSLTVHYLERPVEGEACVTVTVERTGRSTTFTSVRLEQEGRLKASGLVVLASGRTDTIEFQDVSMPEVPQPEDCPGLPEITGPSGDAIPIAARYEMRPALGQVPFSQAGDQAVMGAWIRLAEPQVPDSFSVIAITDSMPPAVMARRNEGFLVLGVPTVDLTVHLHEPLPLPGSSPQDWCLAVFRTKKARAGLLDEDGEIWSRDGLLLAQSRQHALPL